VALIEKKLLQAPLECYDEVRKRSLKQESTRDKARLPSDMRHHQAIGVEMNIYICCLVLNGVCLCTLHLTDAIGGCTFSW